MPNQKGFFEAITDEWRDRGVPLLPPATEIEVANHFQSIGHPLSADVLGLYATAGGFADWEMDRLWSFWPLKRVGGEARSLAKTVVAFSDYLIQSHLYCLVYRDRDTSSVHISYDGTHLREGDPIAGSLVEFLEMLLRAPDAVEAWPLEK